MADVCQFSSAACNCGEGLAIRHVAALPRKGTTERIQMDAFFGGVCVTLAACFPFGNGTETHYTEAVGAVGGRELLAYARREQDSELANIRRAVRWIEGDR